MKRYSVCLFFLSMCHCASTSVNLEADNNFGKAIYQCSSGQAKQHLYIFEQWHLSPNIDSTQKTLKLPQVKNQMSIYRQLDQWVKKEQLHTVLAEGCSGEIDKGFPLQFNGWNYTSLRIAVNGEGYDQIITHIPLKLEVKYKDKLKSICFDDLEMIKTHNLAFSDARGLYGFYARIRTNLNKPKVSNPFLKEVKKVLKLPPDTSLGSTLVKIKSEFKKSIQLIRTMIHQRNQKVLETLTQQGKHPTALVIGGAHVKDLTQQLEKNNIGCTVIRPHGYDKENSNLLEKLEHAATQM